MKKIQYNGSSKILNGIVTKINLIIDKLVVDVKVNGTSVVVVNDDGEREADIDLSLADQNVKQSPTTSSDNSDYRVLLSKSANDTEETDISRKDTNLKYNPSTGNLQTTKLNGNNVPSGSGNDTLAKLSDIPEAQTVATGSVFGALSFDGTDKIVKLSADSQGSGLDLDNFKTAGEYYFDNNHTPLNIPSGNVNGILVVIESASIIKQIWMRQGTKDSNDFQSFVRTCYLSSGNWSIWHPIISGETVSSVEQTTTASKAYAVGDYLMCNGYLYRVTLAISSGDTIAVNTNVTRVYIGDEIENVRNSIPTIPTVDTGSTFGTLSFDGVNKSIKLTADAQSSGKDLNDFKTAGIYNFASANVPTNVPIGTNGVLIVIVFGSVVKQIWMRQGTINSNDHQTYFRTYTTSGWSKWHQLIVGELIGGVENSTTASKAYAKNELMNFNGGIYRVTTAISSGGTISASGSSANVVSTTLSAEIKAIRDALNI